MINVGEIMANRNIPTPLKIIRGNPGRRPISKTEPKPKRILPKMPTDLDPIAKKEWKRLAPIFYRLGILTEVDGMAFAALCTSTAAVIRINQALAECGYKVLAEKTSFLEKKGDAGRSDEVMSVEVKINPLYAQQRLALQTQRFWCQEFGVTPSSRGKINVPDGGDADPQEDFLNGR
jgi:P27 family predicted phage terminase small subunit